LCLREASTILGNCIIILIGLFTVAIFGLMSQSHGCLTPDLESGSVQGDLKEAVLTSPALRALDYTLDSPVILAVDTSYIAVGFFLCQCSPADIKKRIYSRFRSITLNEWEVCFSQPKLEIYGDTL
jgi:hypothetical protein